MSENLYLIKGETLTAMADGVRSIFGTSDKYTPEEMASVIAKIEAGLPSLSNPASSGQILNGYEAINEDGEKITGTIATKTSSNLTANGATVTVPAGYYAANATKSIATATQATPSITVDSNGKITASATQTAGYVTAGTKSSTYQLAFQAAKTITPTTSNQIAVSSGYYTGGSVTVQGDSNLVAENIKNGISIFGVSGTYEGSGGDTIIEDGLIGGRLTEYTNDRVSFIRIGAFASYGSLQTVNFPNCTTIADQAFFACQSLTTINFPVCTTIYSSAFQGCNMLNIANFPACKKIYNYAFAYCTNLTSVSFPACTSIEQSAFTSCSKKLVNVNFPACTNIGNYAFNGCKSLTSVNFPACTNIGNYAFSSCTNLKSVNFPVCINIGSNAFYKCTSLATLILGNSSICTLVNSNAFTSTPIKSGTGYIYVPASLVDAYKTATNWTYFSSRISAIEDMA